MLGTTDILNAQISINVNLDRQPIWGPTGYDYVEYYYLPDIETYYSVPQSRFYYYNNGRWSNSKNLPSRYGKYDYYKSYKVVVNDREPWKNHKNYKEKYSSYKNRHDQQFIRDSEDSKYFVIKKHPKHQNWVIQQKHDNGKHKGKNKK